MEKEAGPNVNDTPPSPPALGVYPGGEHVRVLPP